MEEKRIPTWQVILRSGLLGGVISTYLCIIGIVAAFSERLVVGTFISLGEVLLVVGMVIAGLLTARELKGKSTLISVVSSLLSGVVSSLPLILLIIALLFLAFGYSTKAACLQSTKTGNPEIWVLDLETMEELNLTDHPGQDILPAWSPSWLSPAPRRSSCRGTSVPKATRRHPPASTTGACSNSASSPTASSTTRTTTSGASER